MAVLGDVSMHLLFSQLNEAEIYTAQLLINQLNQAAILCGL